MYAQQYRLAIQKNAGGMPAPSPRRFWQVTGNGRPESPPDSLSRAAQGPLQLRKPVSHLGQFRLQPIHAGAE